MKKLKSNTNIILPARIIKFYEGTQTADIKLCAERVISNTDRLEQVVSRGDLLGVPVHIPSGGGWSLTFPIKTGDTCLIVFSQIGYDHWLYLDKDEGGTIVGQPIPHLKRCFNEVDGFALVGFNTLPRAISQYENAHSQWRNTTKTQNITLKSDDSIDINSPVSLTINAPTVTINANVQVNGTVTTTGDIVSGGISVINHTHTGDSGGTTSKPN